MVHVSQAVEASHMGTPPHPVTKAEIKTSPIMVAVQEEDIEAKVVTVPRWLPKHVFAAEVISERPCEVDDPFYVVDLTKVESKYNEWMEYLPRIKPHYAVKCDPDELVVKTLARLGAGFDCASKPEMDLALKYCSPSDIVYAHCCKPSSHISHAKRLGVDLMTFDNRHELDKIKNQFPDARLLLRVLPDDSRSLCQLGKKFGAALQRVPMLLKSARELDLNVVGVSFHVGSGCYDASAFSDAVVVAYKAWQVGISLGFNFHILDIGGGFPGTNAGEEGLSFKEIAVELNSALETYFPDKRIQIIAEPGRFFVHACSTLVLNVIGKRSITRDKVGAATGGNLDGDNEGVLTSNDQPAFMYYCNDGVYGSFNCTIFDHYNPMAKSLPMKLSRKNLHELDDTQQDEPLYECSIWGPTCDAVDCITKKTELPCLEVGQYIYFDNMGAYTSTAASTFNGFDHPESIYIRRASH